MSFAGGADQVPTATVLTEFAPSGDFSSDPWIGVLPGLGAVSVTADGDIAVSADRSDEIDPQTLAQRERALYWGWAEPLSWVRRGHRLIDGIVVGPRDESDCLVILGDYPESSRLALRMIESGWALLADRPAPHSLDDGVLTAHPRPAPMLIARGRALKDGLAHESVRADSDAVSVEVDRIPEPRRVGAIVLSGVRRPQETTMQVLTGHERFRAATGLFVCGPFTAPATNSPDEAESQTATIAEHLALAQNVFLRLRRTSGGGDASHDELLAWWRERGGRS